MLVGVEPFDERSEEIRVGKEMRQGSNLDTVYKVEDLLLPLGQEERRAGQNTTPSADCLPPYLPGCIIMGL